MLGQNKLLAARDSNRNTLDWQLRGDGLVMNSKIHSQYQELDNHYDLHLPSFNAGVLSIHSSFVGKVVFDELCDMYRRYVDIFSARLSDQVLLNFYFYNNWNELPAHYNIFVNYSQINYFKFVDKIDSYILHFASNKEEDKPWHNANPYFEEWKINFDRANSIDISCPLRPAKFSSLGALEVESRKLLAGWQNLRDKMKIRYYRLWLLKSPKYWLPTLAQRFKQV